MARFLTEASAQNLQPRVPPPKMTLDQMQSIPSSNRVHVKFREGTDIRLTNGQLRGMASSDAAAFQNILSQRRIPANAIRRMFTRPEADLNNERNEGQQRSGKQLPDLNLWYVIDLPPGASPAEVASTLNSLDVVEYAEPELRADAGRPGVLRHAARQSGHRQHRAASQRSWSHCRKPGRWSVCSELCS